MNQFEEKLFDFFCSAKTPFTYKKLFSTIGIRKNKSYEVYLNTFFENTELFIKDGDTIYPKSCFLNDYLLRIIPTPYEIENNILILGHRIIPFQPFGATVESIELYYEDKAIEIEEKVFTLEQLDIYFSLLDIDKMPFRSIKKGKSKQIKEVSISVYKMADFYKKNNFKRGDSIIINSPDFSEGDYNIFYESIEIQNEHILRIDKEERAFLDALKEVLKIKISSISVEKQLLHTYFLLKDRKPTIPLTTIGPLLLKCNDIKITMLPNGSKVLLPKEQSVDELNNLFINEDLRENGKRELNKESLESILNYLGNTNSEVIVRAVIFVQHAFGGYNYERLIEYVFADCRPPLFPGRLEKYFKKQVEQFAREIEGIYNHNPPLLPVNMTRKNVLDCLLSISKFLRSLDRMRIEVNRLPKDEMFALSTITGNLENMLHFFEFWDRQPEQTEGIIELNETIDNFKDNLGYIFENIRDKIELL